MTIEVFLGGLTILSMAAIVIVAMTRNQRSETPNGEDRYDQLRKKHRRRGTKD